MFPTSCVRCFLMLFFKSWEWGYGQTPEFEYVIDGAFKWGQVVRLFHISILPAIQSPYAIFV